MTLTQEMALVHKLQKLGLKLDPFAGVTSRDERREVVRAAVKKFPHMLYDVKGVTLEQAFETAYGCEL